MIHIQLYPNNKCKHFITIALNVIVYYDVKSVMYYDRDEREKGEDDISYNMNVCILVYNMGEKGNSVKYI